MPVSGAVGTVCAAVALGLLGPSPGAAAVAPACEKPPAPSGVIREVPWAQDVYDAPGKIWPFSTGAGVTVAVIDSGVDGRHPQLRGQVLPGYDYVREIREGNVDCLPHGTAVASIIAAKRVSGIGFFGLAPDAKILPVRITNTVQLSPDAEPLDPGTLADAIDYAVDQDAQVLNISAVVYGHDPRLANAVSRALAAGAVVVAAVGNGHSGQRDGTGPTDPSLTPYPAAYDGVIGVGALGPDGQRLESSQIGGYVDLVAPGGEVIAAAVGGHDTYDGTSFASAYVSASAALLLAQRPGVSGLSVRSARAAAVTRRLLATASPVAGASNSLSYGHGLVDPYRALTEPVPGGEASAVAGLTPPPHDPLAEELAAAQRAANRNAMLLSAAAAVVMLVVLAAIVFLPRGHRRRWRPGRSAEPPAANSDDGPEFLPGDALFQPPRSSRT